GMTGDREDFVSRQCVPQLHLAVAAAGDDPTRVRRERTRFDRASMAGQSPQLAPGGDVPDLQLLIRRCGVDAAPFIRDIADVYDAAMTEPSGHVARKRLRLVEPAEPGQMITTATGQEVPARRLRRSRSVWLVERLLQCQPGVDGKQVGVCPNESPELIDARP